MDEVRCGQQWLQAKAGGREERLREEGDIVSISYEFEGERKSER